jgi:hypothetical protein
VKLLFLHIPKTGGTSLVNNVLLPGVPFEHRYTEDDLVLHPAYRGHRNMYGEMLYLSNHYPLRYADVFRLFVRNGLVPADRQLYSGHFCYGAHEALAGGGRYLTVIREPVARVISNYNLHRSIGAFTGSFADYLRSDWYQAHNLQVRMLCRDGMPAGRSLATDHLAEAKFNLAERFDFCALEHLDAFARDLMGRHGWTFPYTDTVHNRTTEMDTVKGNPAAKHRSFTAEVSDADRRHALEVNALDAELYACVRAESAARWQHPRLAAA